MMMYEFEKSDEGIPLTATGYTAAEWAKQMDLGGHVISGWPRKAISETDYDLKHRFEPGMPFEARLLFGREISKDSERTTGHLKDFAFNKFVTSANPGNEPWSPAEYLEARSSFSSNLKAELVFLLRQKVTNAELKRMGIHRIVVLHDPIAIFDERVVLQVDRFDFCSRIGADSYDTLWGGGVAFAFPLLRG